MILDSLNVAASSLKTQQKALDVVANNIANVNTPGYSRQVADITTLSPESVGNLSFGRGVNVSSVQRIVSPIIDRAMTANSTKQSYWNTLNTGLNTVENVFGSLQSTGLASSLDNFFLSWQQLANNPQDNAQKMNVRAKSETLVTNIKNMNQQMVAAQTSANSQIDGQIQQANQLIDTITSLSTRIKIQESNLNGTAGAANTLRDQRDQAINSLSKFLPVNQVNTQGGGLLLQTASGDLLTQHGVSHHLALGATPAGGFASVVIASSGQVVKNVSQGGSIGALIELRDNKLGGYLKRLDSISANLAFSVNQIHGSASSGTAATTMTSGQVTNAALALNNPAQTAPFASKIQSGSFKIYTYDTTGAAAPPGGTTIPITAGVTTMNDVLTSLNAVSGITAGLDPAGHLNISATAGSSFALSSDSSNMLAAYEVNSYFTGSNAASLDIAAPIKANPASIATGRVDPLTSTLAPANNSAALAIMQLQNQAISIDGSASASLHERTTSISSQYGIDVATSKQQQQYFTAEASSINSQRQAISGVSTDQELVSMIKFQNAYQAAAKIITTTNQMLNTLIGLIR